MELSVYAMPVQEVSPSAENIRKNLINHEASVKSIGTLYYLGSTLIIIAGIMGLIRPNEDPVLINLLFCFLFIGLGVFQICVGRGLQTLRKWSRIAAFILSCIGLLAFPIGTVVNAYVLYLVACKKGETVFSDEYKSVIMATPHIRYKTSIVVWIFLILLVALMGIAAIAAMTSNVRH